MARKLPPFSYVFHVDLLRRVRKSDDVSTDPTPPSAVSRIIDKFGGLTAMAKALGHRNVSTVQGWKDRQRVPSAQIPAVIEAGKGVEPPIVLTPNDFFDLAPVEKPTEQGRAA
jgi:hypothetical protein